MLRRPISWLTSAALLIGTAPMPLRAQQMVPKGSPIYQPVQAMTPGQPPGPDQPPMAIYSPERLDAILAPIALYPDVLLTQVLMASGFPLQLVDAARWVQQGNNRALRGEALERALAGRNWDPSVKSLVPFPAVLVQMTANLEWLQDLGTAALQQQPDVMDSVQRLRQRAEAAGSLRTNERYIVRTEERYVYIEPAQPELIYVPAYNPVEVYGTWAYPAYPPVYLPPPPGYGWGTIVGPVLVFGAGVAITAALWDLGRPRWRDRNIFVNTNRYNMINVNRPPLQNNVWHPANTNTFQRGGLAGPTGAFGGAGGAPGGPAWRGQGGPHGPAGGAGFGGAAVGGGMSGGSMPRGPVPGGMVPGGSVPGGAGGAPGHQFRDRGAPGTVGNSGITPPGQQFRDRGAPGTAGNSGVIPPRHQDGTTVPGGGGSQFRPQGGGAMPHGGGGAMPGGSGGGGASPQFRSQGGGAPIHGGGGGGGGGGPVIHNSGGGGGAGVAPPHGGGGGGGGGNHTEPQRRHPQN